MRMTTHLPLSSGTCGTMGQHVYISVSIGMPQLLARQHVSIGDNYFCETRL